MPDADEITDPYERGHSAHDAGQGINANPHASQRYGFSAENARLWAMGWQDADDEQATRNRQRSLRPAGLARSFRWQARERFQC